jgi:hypothetical protein
VPDWQELFCSKQPDYFRNLGGQLTPDYPVKEDLEPIVKKQAYFQKKIEKKKKK